MKFPRRVEYLKNRPTGVKFWDEHWHKQDVKRQVEQVGKDPVTMIVRKWIEDTIGEGEHPGILEGGCGTGRYLVYFGKLGYDMIGLDFSVSAVEAAQKIDANLKVVQATVLDLPFASESFDYYLSFGVLEHFIDGPEQGLKEAHRVLKENGMFFLSVPYMSNWRLLEERFPALLGKSSSRQGELKGNFYQYYFTKEELNYLLTSLGFKVLKDYPVNQELGLLRAVPFARKNRALNYFVINLARVSKFLLPHFCAHMILLICRKVD